MIRTVKISNFKSVQDLEIELGRLNVFIGENGCGKTNVLEGIAMGSAAYEEKLGVEFLTSRGIRMPGEELMKSAFTNHKGVEPIIIAFNNQEIFPITILSPTVGGNGQQWVSIDSKGHKTTEDAILAYLEMIGIAEEISEYTVADREKLINKINEYVVELQETQKTQTALPSLSSFLTFCPEYSLLQRFEEEGQIRPLGIRGEGLFRHLVELSKEEPETFKAISEQLSLIDWFGGLSIPNDLQFTERRIAITDRFIADTIKEFDQRSANEGFLYLLFYFTLFLSKYTPGFFAIDNIDNSLNPKLGAKLIEMLAKLSKENNKQVILTTHNPAILDGLDLTDDEQRLFVIYRNADGETKARRVKPLSKVEGVEEVRLSEAFVRGYLGGLPKNF